jgi:serine/threonine-protein kinase
VKQSFDGKVSIGNVISQDPAAGTQTLKGGVVNLNVSKGTQQIAVPSVTGQTQSQASAALEAASFKVSVKTATSSSVAQGTVISQTPAAGVTAVAGSTVAITVSSGVGTVTVPNLNGMSQAQAGAQLGGLGLKVSVEGTGTGNVVSQSPATVTQVAPGSTVTITLAP